MNKLELSKSPVNYTGGKFKLLPQLLPLFPDNINTCIDFFTGGANVGVNVDAKKIICFDIVEPLISLYKTLQSTAAEKSIEKLEHIIQAYNLTNTYRNGYSFYHCNSSDGVGKVNKASYNQLKQDYNTHANPKMEDYLFFTLIIYGFNNQIRFNANGEFNIPAGKRDFNASVRKNLRSFIEAIQSKNIDFYVNDFRNIDVEFLGENDFVYADPPYLIKTATYNEQSGWTEREETDLFMLLDQLNKRKIKFALSNVLESGEKKNLILEEWAKSYHVHDLNYSYRNSSYQKKDKTESDREVLITNY